MAVAASMVDAIEAVVVLLVEVVVVSLVYAIKVVAKLLRHLIQVSYRH